MNKMKTIVLGSVLAASAVASSVAMAEASANIGFTSNYMWRGTTQTNGGSAISGGLDYSSDVGVYAGIWTSNTAWGSPEVDLYAGFAGEVGDFGYDISVIEYGYPYGSGNFDWTETNLGLSYGAFSFSYGTTSDVFATDTDADYMEIGFETEISKGLSLSLTAGSYDFDIPAVAGYDDYNVYTITLSKDDFSFMYSDTDLDPNLFVDGEAVFVASYSKSFDL